MNNIVAANTSLTSKAVILNQRRVAYVPVTEIRIAPHLTRPRKTKLPADYLGIFKIPLATTDSNPLGHVRTPDLNSAGAWDGGRTTSQTDT